MAEKEGKVYVVDDDIDLGPSIARMLCRNGWRASSFESPEKFIAAYVPNGPVCIISDMCMGTMNGFDLADRIRAIDPAAGLVFMTAWPETEDAVDAIRRRGGLDYLDKPLNKGRLFAAITDALSWSAQRREAVERLSVLTPRERQVMELLAEGHTNKSAAQMLGLTDRTVEDHRASMMRKAGFRTMQEIVAAVRATQ